MYLLFGVGTHTNPHSPIFTKFGSHILFVYKKTGELFSGARLLSPFLRLLQIGKMYNCVPTHDKPENIVIVDGTSVGRWKSSETGVRYKC